MSAHLNRDSLWELASSAHLPQAIQEHLHSCGDCQVQLAQVKQAQAVLRLRAPAQPPPLDPIAARRIGAVLKEAAEQQLRPKRWWLFGTGFGWALAGVAAVVLAILVWNQAQTSPAPMPIAQQAPAPAPEQLVQKPEVVEPAPVPTPAPKLLAKVTGAKKARSQDGKLQKAQTVAEGSKVATAAGGALWLALPDGSRAGLTGNTELKIDKLEEQALSFTLEKGNVMMVARHLPERMMTVKAGDLEVRDIGTRFLVSRDVNRVLVAVEEGVVEINAPGTQMTLKAGRSVEWREGVLREQPWAPPPPRAQAAVVASPPTPAIEAFVRDAGPAAVAAAPVPLNPDEEWASPPNLPKTGTIASPGQVADPPVYPAPVPEGDEPPVYEAPPEDEEGSVSLLARMEDRLRRVTRAVQAPFAAVGATIRETRSREIGRLADEGNCEEALKRADAWLADKPSVSTAEPRWKRAVMVNQMRCYTRLNRSEDASRIKSKLE